MEHDTQTSSQDQEQARNQAVASAPALGLTTAEAEARRLQFGLNEITAQKPHAILKFLGFFWGPIPAMIEVAAVIAVLIHHWDDFYIIVAMLLLNAGVGFWQRQIADNAIDLLKQKLALDARVRRDGQWQEILARDLVPGDLVRVRLYRGKVSQPA